MVDEDPFERCIPDHHCIFPSDGRYYAWKRVRRSRQRFLSQCLEDALPEALLYPQLVASVGRLHRAPLGRQQSANQPPMCSSVSLASSGAMCAGTIFWSGVRRVMYGSSAGRTHELSCDSEMGPALRFSCREVLAAGTRTTEFVASCQSTAPSC